MRFPRVIRRGAAALLGHARLRVRSGPNRGRWWSVASAGRGALAGTFEQQRVSALLGLLCPGDVVWDIGAHKGYVALAMARRVGDDGSVRAFEPSPENLQYLRRHMQWNGVRNVCIDPVALSDSEGEARFGGRGSSITFRLGGGDELVSVSTVATRLRQGVTPPTVLKLDVEAGEAGVLRGAGDALASVGLVFVAVHTRELYEECRLLLERHGFRVYRSAAMRSMMQRLPDGWSTDPDLLAIAPHRIVGQSDLQQFSGVKGTA
ncbi:MAG: FkbM family methyltransferase [Gemmatimonadota bacterium]